METFQIVREESPGCTDEYMVVRKSEEGYPLGITSSSRGIPDLAQRCIDLGFKIQRKDQITTIGKKGPISDPVPDRYGRPGRIVWEIPISDSELQEFWSAYRSAYRGLHQQTPVPSDAKA